LSACDAELARRVVVLDKASFPREKICAGAVGARADRLLESIGVRVDVPCIEVRGLKIRARMGTLSARLPNEQTIGRVVRRFEFDAALLDHVRARGVRVRDGVTLKQMVRQNGGWRLETSAGPLSVRAVVGADGVGSTVRRSAGIAKGRYHAQVVEVDTAWCDSDAPEDLLSFDVSDTDLTGYAWDFPTVVDGKPLVCRGVYELTRGAPTPTRGPDVTGRLMERLARRGIDGASLRFKRFAERGISLNAPTAVDRVLLVGEAAGIDPVLGEGIPQAIFYGREAAHYLSACARRGDYSFIDWPRSIWRSRVGVDLTVRAAAVPFFYGKRLRRVAESWVTRSQALAQAGMCYFGGQRVSRKSLGNAIVDLGRAFVD
jgi:flavin-dependent dehydrogenase